jgi:hypothetical protein
VRGASTSAATSHSICANAGAGVVSRGTPIICPPRLPASLQSAVPPRDLCVFRAHPPLAQPRGVSAARPGWAARAAELRGAARARVATPPLTPRALRTRLVLPAHPLRCLPGHAACGCRELEVCGQGACGVGRTLLVGRPISSPATPTPAGTTAQRGAARDAPACAGHVSVWARPCALLPEIDCLLLHRAKASQTNGLPRRGGARPGGLLQ